MWRTALWRIAAVTAVVIVATAVISLALGALAHAPLEHSVAVGYYVVGAGALIGSLAFGLRGPRRREYGDGDRPAGQLFSFSVPRKVRRATSEERFEAKRSSLLFFAVGILFIAIGAAFDPTRSIV
jgi:hypothetical protein